MKDRYDIGEELKCEYLISSNRKKLWVIELDLLEMLENACRELNIDYFILFGSALGAVRHDGFIPWDDDIDLGMTREHFEVFLKNYKRFFPEYVDIQYGVSNSGVDFLLRIRDSRSTGIIRGESHRERNKGAFIEIYVFDRVRDDRSQKRQLFMSKLLCSALSMINTPEIRSVKGFFRKLPLTLFGASNLWKLYEKVCKKYDGKETGYYNLVSLPKYGNQRRFMIDRESVMSTGKLPFEYTSARIPVGNDKYLTQLYGDYMKLPPVEKRGTHHENIVYYDPNVSYKEYNGSDIPERYFGGDSTLELL